MNQKRFVDLAGVKLALYFERLPECLKELPFVDPANMPPFPRHPERGIRPPGQFFDFFGHTDAEQVVWACSAADFEAFGYKRFDPGLPESAPNALRIHEEFGRLEEYPPGHQRIFMRKTLATAESVESKESAREAGVP